MTRKVYIYALLHPTSKRVRYVGKSINPRHRFTQHLNYGNDRQIKWTKSLRMRGLKPILKIVKETDSSNWQYWERHYIKYFRRRGYRLLNKSAGGGTDGSRFRVYKKLSDETKAKISKAKKGTHWGHHTKATKKKMSKIRMGMKFSEEHRNNLSKAWIGRVLSDEEKAKRKLTKGKVNIGKYILYSPSNERFVTKEGLTKFCEDNGLQGSLMASVIYGKRKHHRGWTGKKWGAK